MKIMFEMTTAFKLLTLTTMIRGEFSGIGKVERDGEDFIITGFMPMAFGSEVFTEIPATKMLEIIQRPDAGQWRCWLHQHPMGSGVPGPENWSGMDNNTIRTAPLGGVPEMVKWSISVVHTPHGWVGRLDTYVNPHTEHLEVTPNLQPELEPVVALLQAEWAEAKRAEHKRAVTWLERASLEEAYKAGRARRQPSRASTQGNFFSKIFRGKKREYTREAVAACGGCFGTFPVDDIDADGCCPSCRLVDCPECGNVVYASQLDRDGMCPDCSVYSLEDEPRERVWFER